MNYNILVGLILFISCIFSIIGCSVFKKKRVIHIENNK